jgi:hypothetical protein
MEGGGTKYVFVRPNNDDKWPWSIGLDFNLYYSTSNLLAFMNVEEKILH